MTGRSRADSAGLSIRQARPDELAALRAIEIDCVPMFVEAGALQSADQAHPTSLAQFDAFCASGLLFAAADHRRLIGFLAAREADGGLYIAEIDVLRAAQQRGIGTRLLEAARGEAVRRGFPEITLTTHLSLPWNRPWYLRRGFADFSPGQRYSSLAAQLAGERLHASNPALRIAMRRKTDTSILDMTGPRA